LKSEIQFQLVQLNKHLYQQSFQGNKTIKSLQEYGNVRCLSGVIDDANFIGLKRWQ